MIGATALIFSAVCGCLALIGELRQQPQQPQPERDYIDIYRELSPAEL